MATAFGFDLAQAAQGVVFRLNIPAKLDRRQIVGDWEVELRSGSRNVCVRGGVPDQAKALDTIAAAAHPVAEDFLDILAVEERTPMLIVEPHDATVWRQGAHGLKVQLTASITFSAEPLALRAVTTDKAGNVVAAAPYVPPPHHPAYRYFRYSQAARNVFDAYRNMFLALESVLDHIAPKRHDEAETDWLRGAIAEAAQKHGADLAPFISTAGKDPVASFIDAHYAAVRCALFHAKSSAGQRLAPGSLGSHDLVLHQLLAVQKLVEDLLKSLFKVRLPSGGFFHSGFGDMLRTLAPVTHLLAGPVETPTVEQLLAQTGNYPEGGIFPVTFDGLRHGVTDEWTYLSEIKCAEVDFTRIGALRLIAYDKNQAQWGTIAMFLIPIMNKMNAAALTADLELTGVNKLAIRVRCVLRNVQGPRRGFAS